MIRTDNTLTIAIDKADADCLMSELKILISKVPSHVRLHAEYPTVMELIHILNSAAEE